MHRHLRAALWVTAALSAGFSTAVAEQQTKIKPATPAWQLKLKAAPEGTPLNGGLAWRYPDGTTGLRLTLGDHLFETRSIPPAGGSPGAIVVTLRGATVDERWEFDRGLFERFGRAAAYAVQTFGMDHTVEELGLALEHELSVTDLQSLSDMDRRLLQIAGAEEMIVALRGVIAQSSVGSQEGCYDALGGTFLRLGGSIACWATVPATLGLQSMACVGASILTLAAATEAWEQCVDPCPSCGGGGDDDPPPCDDPDLQPGDPCLCLCPGEVCCDWPDAE